MKNYYKKLYKIFNYYNKKYNLKTSLEVVNDFTVTAFHVSSIKTYILISLEYIKNHSTAYLRFKTKNIKKLLLYALLHEIKHCIDYNNNSDKYLLEYHNQSHIDHDKRPLEILCDNFAINEYKKLTHTGHDLLRV